METRNNHKDSNQGRKRTEIKEEKGAIGQESRKKKGHRTEIKEEKGAIGQESRKKKGHRTGIKEEKGP